MSTIFSNAEIRSRWDTFAPMYKLQDSTMQTFYYTLINMLALPTANSILQIACGTAKLLPLALSLKSNHCHYTATDLSPIMIELAKLTLQQYLDKMGVKQLAEEWLAERKTVIKDADGELPIEEGKPFDRIICNLVLMITEDPLKMMQNLHGLAAPGCLMGVTIWGQKSKSNLLTLSERATEVLGLPPIPYRSNFHLYGKIPELAEASGWEVVILWEQNAPFHHFSLDEQLLRMMENWAKKDPQVFEYHVQEVKATFDKKQNLNFPVQMAVLRKK